MTGTDRWPFLLALTLTAAGCATRAGVDELPAPAAARPPAIDPDYADLVVPPNLAPLNFAVGEPGTAYRVTIAGDGAAPGDGIEVESATPEIRIPPGPWRALLAAQRGGRIVFDVSVRGGDGAWRRFAPIANRVAAEPIDAVLVYRLLKPLYNKYVHMGIYQRDLSTFDESPILENRHAGNACVNCHTFHANRPDPMLLETRGPGGSPVLLARDGAVQTIDTRNAFHPSPATYATWHPDGRHLCFSLNNATLFFHTHPSRETREVFDASSELAVYDLVANLLTTAPAISSPERAETWPEWSADGRHLYFSSAAVTPIEAFATVRYDLMRIGFDPQTGAWGELETVLSAAQTGKSILQPKASPDGRFLVCTLADHGNFPIFLDSSDLYAIDLRDGSWRRLEINSDRVDSWHAWSSNSRWLVFSSKRRDGLFARPYLSYVDAAGVFHKPILLPQEDPGFYDACIQTYNVPVLVSGPVEVSQRDLARAIDAPRDLVRVRLDPRVAAAVGVDAGAPTEPYSPGSTR